MNTREFLNEEKSPTSELLEKFIYTLLASSVINNDNINTDRFHNYSRHTQNSSEETLQLLAQSQLKLVELYTKLKENEINN